MTSSTTGNAAFGRALLDPATPAPDGIVGPDGAPAPKRFNVYRNNVVVGLREALARSFPAICTLLGEDYFSALARAYLDVHPPASPVLTSYGDRFAEFVAAFPPLKNYPYLTDVARAEYAWLQAYHAADAAPLDAGRLALVAPEDLGALALDRHPAAAVLRSDWPVYDLLRANRFAPDQAGEIDLGAGQSVLIARPAFEVTLTRLPPGGDLFAAALFQGHSLAEAAAEAQAGCAAFDLSASLTVCLSEGVFMEPATA